MDELEADLVFEHYQHGNQSERSLNAFECDALESPIGEATETDALLLTVSTEDEYIHSKSSYAQTLFNAVNILMGIGLLALPYALRITGWVVGGIMLVVFCLMTRHTAKLLAECMDYRSSAGDASHTYGDIGQVAFGSAGRSFISVVFVLELVAACVALVILTADSLCALFPELSLDKVKIATICLVMPLTWSRSLGFISYGSLVGVVALANLLVILVVDGLTTIESPGSLLVPADTHLLPNDWYPVPLAIGLIMAGFCGHSVFPNLYRDMKEPKHYNAMVDHSYIVTTFIYAAVASCGYLMFGSSTMEEISRNLPLVASYNKVLTQMTVWLVALNPLTKYPLAISPVNTQLERLFAPWCSPDTHLPVRIAFRSSLSLVILIIAIYFPNFDKMMGILGSFFSFTVSIIFPECVFLKLFGKRLTLRRVMFEMLVIAVGLVCMSIGTVWAFLPGV